LARDDIDVLAVKEQEVEMAAGKYNTTIRRGDTFQETFTFVDTLLTGYSGIMQWKSPKGAVLITCSSTAVPSTLTIAVGAANTVITPIVTAVQTAALPIGGTVYTLQTASASGVVTTYLEGVIKVTGAI
jgi:hypothetical protein